MKKIIALAMALVLAFGVISLAGCGAKKETEEKLIMATNASFPPYEFKEGENYAGIDVEIAGLIAEKLGKKLEIKDVEFGSIVGGVQTGKFDIGMAGMTVTDERKKSVNFTTSYAKGVQAIIVPEGSPIKSADDLKGKKIAVQQDTTGDIYATDDYGEANIVRFKTGNDAVQALVSKKVEAVIIDNEPAKSYVASNKGLVILPTAYIEEDYAIAISKDNDDLLNQVNKALDELTKDGSIQKIIDKYIAA